jgi:ABC-type branched-subunit amino acid transport system ATPase component
VLPASSGRITFDGHDITDLTSIQRIERGIVLVSGGRGVFGSLSVADNLRLASWLARRRGETDFVESTIERIYALFPILRERSRQRAGLLSGGEQQMLTIAQALLCRPKLLMIDELSLGLAPGVVATLLDAVRQLRDEGMTIVLVEQSMNIAAAIAPRAIFLEKGTVRFTGPTKELASEKALVRSVFLSSEVQVREMRTVGDEESQVVLETRSLCKAFGGVNAVSQVDLQLHKHQILGVIGANGAGKTTLFDIICGFVTPDSGRVLLRGRDVTNKPSSARFAIGLGRTFQDLRLVPSMTVSELLAVALERHVEVRDPVVGILGLPSARKSERHVRERVGELIELFNLQPYSSSFISELSTGTRRIVELAAVSAHRPSVLVLDEPSSGLAQREAEAMVPLLLDLRERLGTTIAIIEHDIPMIRALSDEVVCMHLGSVLARGPADDVLTNPAVVASYLGVNNVAVERSGGTNAGFLV